ncbi:MAG TPA: nucleotidyltransferase domain-containing protein [Thermoflexia bacterium]|nr:nucleotidyltransferase domain-containing protein [Thermoflexia bacterium]
MSDIFEIAAILVTHAVQSHAGEIAIIAYYGSYAKGLASPTSDLDIFYIPDHGKAKSLSSQFIIEGRPYDFWPVSWELAEGIANATPTRPWVVAASLIADAKVLYQRSPADLARFQALQTRITELTQPAGRSTLVKQALVEFKQTFFQLEQLRLALATGDVAGTRWASHKFIDSAVNALALVNQRYFAKGWEVYPAQIADLPQSPAGFEELARNILRPSSQEELLEAANKLAQEVRKILVAAQGTVAKPASAAEVFKDSYFFVFEYKNKVLQACEHGNALAAEFAAFRLQTELCQMLHKVEHGFYGTDFNLLGEYTAAYAAAGFPDLLASASQGELVELAQQVQRLDAQVRAWLTGQTIDLNILANEEELRCFLNCSSPRRRGEKRE